MPGMTIDGTNPDEMFGAAMPHLRGKGAQWWL
jgi:hypothetical protein